MNDDTPPDEASRGATRVRPSVDLHARATAEALHESEERYRRLIESINDYAVFGMDLERRVTVWNEGAEQILGWTEAEILGRYGDVIFVPEDCATAEPEKEARTALVDGRAMDERWHVRKDGSRFWGSGAMMVIRAPDGRPRGFVKVVRDATVRRLNEEALRASEARFRAVANLVPDLLWQADPTGRMSWYNARWYAYTGQSAEEAAGYGWTDAVHPEEREDARSAYAEAVDAERPVHGELRIRDAQGSFRWFLVRAEPLRDESGRIIAFFGAATDVQVHRVALEAAEAGRREVERRVAERTDALLRAEIERTSLRRQLAGAEEQERRRLARELHDQLGQHLTALALGLDEVRRLVDPDAAAHALLDRLQELTHAMTRDARSLALKLRPPELDDLGLESAIGTYVSEWSARYGIAADVELTGTRDAPIPSDAGGALYRIVQEALTNVAKHAGATHVSVIVEQSPDAVLLIVEDNGHGFEVDATLARARQQRRLGLAGMRERASLLGGTLHVESGLKSGTTLYVRLPLPRG